MEVAGCKFVPLCLTADTCSCPCVTVHEAFSFTPLNRQCSMRSTSMNNPQPDSTVDASRESRTSSMPSRIMWRRGPRNKCGRACSMLNGVGPAIPGGTTWFRIPRSRIQQAQGLESAAFGNFFRLCWDSTPSNPCCQKLATNSSRSDQVVSEHVLAEKSPPTEGKTT